MLQYLYKGKAIGERAFFRQIRSIIVLLAIIFSYWLVNRDLLKIYCFLSGVGIFILIADYNRPRKALAETAVKFSDILIILATNIFLAGVILITCAAKSPLNGLLVAPIVLFTAEYGRTVGTINFFGVTLFMIINLFCGTKFSLVSLVSSFAIILAALISLLIINTLHYFMHRFHQKIDRLLTYDELTNLYSRRFLRYAVLKEVKAERRFGFVIIDINYFKYYNDCWGHTAGDDLLICFGKTLKSCVRSQDIIVRYSGDEFIIMMPEADQAQIDQVLAQIIKTIDSHHFQGEECFPDRKLSISYGSALYPDDACNYHDLFVAADQALFRYKKDRRAN